MTPELLYELFGFYNASRCIEVKSSYEVVCNHPYPFTPRVHSIDEIMPTAPVGNREYVQLKPVANGTKETKFGKVPNMVGYAGKCPLCGNVFYRGV